MAEAAKGINPDITPEEVKEEVKQATAEVLEKAPSLASSEMMGSSDLTHFTRWQPPCCWH